MALGDGVEVESADAGVQLGPEVTGQAPCAFASRRAVSSSCGTAGAGGAEAGEDAGGRGAGLPPAGGPVLSGQARACSGACRWDPTMASITAGVVVSGRVAACTASPSTR